MWYSLWTAKPGAGCSVVTAAFGMQVADASRHGALIVDLGGDLGAILGVDDSGPGLTEWLAAADAGAEELSRLETPVLSSASGSVLVLNRGRAHSWAPHRVDALLAALHQQQRDVVVDVATIDTDVGDPMQRLRSACLAEGRSVLVTRACYIAVRRALALTLRPDAIALVREHGRSLDKFDLTAILGAPVGAEIDVDPAVARSVDSGSLASRCPRVLARQVRGLLS